MLPVFTAEEMRRLDRRAIAELGIPGVTLMENAGAGAAREILSAFGPLRGRKVVVLCGKGNNGGDGFVVARHLLRGRARLRVFLLGAAREVKGDAAVKLGELRRARGAQVTEVMGAGGFKEVEGALAGAALIVDGLLGTGLTGPAEGLVARAIGAINASGRPVVALDLPSGLSSDTGALLGPTVAATLTTTFAGWKRGLLLYPGAAHAGRVRVVPIGIPPAEVSRGISVFLLEPSDIQPLLQP
ncbi:MAG: NAD(P)H-hydrate epimerase, partial [Candidatus Methylomirabilales bacterium]